MFEAARKQGLYEPVLQAVLEAQPRWHDDPQIQAAWETAEAAGLGVEKAREVLNAPEITATLELDEADIQAFEVKGTPTFSVKGEPLPRLNPQQQLYDLVRSEVAATR
nr:DsbA family protein [Hydrocarboniclastica marina]